MPFHARRLAPPLAVLFAFIVLGVTAGAFRWVDRRLPSPYRLQDIQPAQKTVVLDIHGQTVHEFFKENRDLVPLAAVPRHVVEAILATEDRKFYEHWGVDVLGMFRAGLKNLRTREVRQGGSTITQQLARNLFLTHDRTFKRKLQEIVLAVRVERIYSKDEILELYLNQVYFGEGAYGVKAAARTFLGREVEELSLAECALVAGLPGNPRDFNPRLHPEAATWRRHVVLSAMLATGAIDQTEFEEADAVPLEITEQSTSSAVGPYFVEIVRQYLIDRYGPQELYEGGLRVYTTLDLELQRVAETALEQRMLELEEQIEPAETRDQYAGKRAEIEAEGKHPPAPAYLQGALISMDARSGHVAALVGGRSFSESPFNRATQARRQPGSAFKPFVYTAAIDNGFRGSDIILDTPVVFQGATADEEWRPQNYTKDLLGSVTLRFALKKSINIPAIKLLRKVGVSVASDYARRMGIRSPIQRVLSVALGTSEVTLDELTASYTAFANQGIRCEPLYVLRVEDRDGKILEVSGSRSEEALSSETAAIMTNILEDVIKSGTGQMARWRGLTRPAAGKTGTTDEYNNGWFIGFTPDIVTGVWVGFDSNETIGDKMEGARVALPIWTDYMLAATRDHLALPFPVPSSMVTCTVCYNSGMRARDACPEPYDELYKAGTEPDALCTFHTRRAGPVGSRDDSWKRPEPISSQQPEPEGAGPRVPEEIESEETRPGAVRIE
jgi:penicillin-binding protein 1A